MKTENVPNSQGLTANVAANGEASGAKWYIAQVRSCCEKRVAAKIQSLGYEAFVPIQKEIHHWSDRDKLVDRIVIPMVVFVKIPKKDINIVRNLSFVFSLLTAPGSKDPAIVPDEQIESFCMMLKQQEKSVNITQKSELKIGDHVIVVRGPLKGVTGVIHFSPNGTEICVEINMLGFACASINQNDVELCN